jgi:hypothetical protein
MRRKAKAKIVLERLAEVILIPETELHYSSPFQLLVAVMLSAQCTDKRVNMMTPALFERYPTPQSLLGASFDEGFHLHQKHFLPRQQDASPHPHGGIAGRIARRPSSRVLRRLDRIAGRGPQNGQCRHLHRVASAAPCGGYPCFQGRQSPGPDQGKNTLTI